MASCSGTLIFNAVVALFRALLGGAVVRIRGRAVTLDLVKTGRATFHLMVSRALD